MRSVGLSGRLFIPWLLVVLAASLGHSQDRTVRIGTALDGPLGPEIAVRTPLQDEVRQLVGARFEVAFPPESQLVGDWSAALARRNIDTLLADPEIDIVVVLGYIGPAYAVRRADFPKPVVAAAIDDPEIEGVPVEVLERPMALGGGVERVRVSGIANLNYIAFNRNLLREVEVFRDITRFSRLVVLALDGWLSENAGMTERASEALRGMGVESTFVPVGDTVDAALARIPPDTEAVMVAALPHLSPDEFDLLVSELGRRGLPSYSFFGQRDVRRGIMASLMADRNEQFFVRRVALNLFNILQGQDAGTLPVDFRLDEQLTINLVAARAAGVDPTFALLTEAQVLDEPKRRAARRTSLSSVIREAETVNLDLIAAERSVQAGFQLVREARSALLPQASVSAGGTFIDKDRASPFQRRRQAAGGVGVNQILYSEQARSAYDAERHLQTAREEDRFQLRLDVILEAAQAYLDVLRTKTVEEIQEVNLALTRSNLGLARARTEVGAAGRDELLRWRSQLAQDRRRVIESSAQRNRAEINLNRVLNRPLEEDFETLEAGLDDPELTVNLERLRPFVQSPGAFRVFREFMTGVALEASPELRRFDAGIRVQERILVAAKRAFYVPTVGLNAELQAVGGGNDELGFPQQGPDSTNWTVGIQAALPVFQGGQLRAQRTRATLELNRLTTEREATRLLIEQRIRSALHLAGASFAGIGLAQEAALAAQENLDLVRDAYSEGLVSIVRLLDAQAQALSARLASANAVFDHLVDLMDTQRGAGRFDYFRSAEEREALIRDIENYYQERGHAPASSQP